MPIATLARPLSALLLLAVALAPLRAQPQDVYVSEVRADGSETWIEVHNRGGAAANLSTWSLHAATRTPGMPQGYWWAFPAGTSLAAGAYLRVHWFRSAPPTPAPGNLYTGTSPYGFLFGLGGEALSGTAGAVALFRSQANTKMTSPEFVQREPLAVAAGLWVAGRAAPPIPDGSSLARDPAAIGATAFPDEEWFVDASPTPLAPNVSGAVVESYGAACALPGHHLLGVPTLRAQGLPLLGNQGFGLVVDHTTGIYGEFVLVCFSAAAAPAGQPPILPPFAGIGCQVAIDATQLLSAFLVPAQVVGTPLPLPLAGPPSIVGTELHAQAVVVELLPYAYPPYQGASNAVRLVVGQ